MTTPFVEHKFLDALSLRGVQQQENLALALEAIKLLSNNNMLSNDGIIVYETDEIENVPENIEEYERYNYKKYGRNILNFYRRKG